jgi:hypothetical protein
MLNIYVSTMKHVDCTKIKFNLSGIHVAMFFSNAESLFCYDLLQKKLNIKIVTLDIST